MQQFSWHELMKKYLQMHWTISDEIILRVIVTSIQVNRNTAQKFSWTRVIGKNQMKCKKCLGLPFSQEAVTSHFIYLCAFCLRELSTVFVHSRCCFTCNVICINNHIPLKTAFAVLYFFTHYRQQIKAIHKYTPFTWTEGV